VRSRSPNLTPAQLAGLLERLPDIVWRYRVQPTPGFDYVSPSVFALTGYTPEDHYADPDLGRRIAHPDDAPLIEATLAAPDANATVMIRWRHRSGATFATEQRITAVRDATGAVVALEGVGRPVMDGERRYQMQAGDLVIDLATHRVLVDGRVVELTPAEHRILAQLAATDGPVSAEALAARLWGAEHPGGTRVVQVHVSNLRRKLEPDPRFPRRLVTHRGVGYALARGAD
jgi:DNA-binding winged helix-turn-helix (wHTH) protein